MDILDKIEMIIGEGASDGKSFGAKKKSTDMTSGEKAKEAEDNLRDMEIDANKDGDGDGLTPEEEKEKEKKQKELKAKAKKETRYTPPYAAS